MQTSVQNKGYTLIEMLIYVATVSIAASIVVFALVGFGKAYVSYKAAQDVHRNASFALERISREIRSANSVATGSSTLNSNPGRLTLNTTDAAGNSTTIEFAVQGGRLVVKEGSGAYSPLMASGVTVTSFVVEHFVGTETEAVRVKLKLTRTRGSISKDATFWSAAVLRGSYSG